MADSIKLGNLDISAFKVGSDDCKVYLGDTLLYSGGTTPPTPTLQWSTIPSDGSSVDLNGVKIYGIKGNIDNMTYFFAYTSNINVNYDYNNNNYVVNIGNGCYTNTYNGGNIELVFSELGCSDYYTTDATISQSYFGFQILIEI